MKDKKQTNPDSIGDVIVYACSGCSSSAQMANFLAVKMDREGIAEMSCIAGVGGGVKSLVNRARSAAMIVGIDGCPLKCVEQCLKQHNLKSTVHFDLSEMKVAKEYHCDFDETQAQNIYRVIVEEVKRNTHDPSSGKP